MKIFRTLKDIYFKVFFILPRHILQENNNKKIGLGELQRRGEEALKNHEAYNTDSGFVVTIMFNFY